ncbi:hypothetical protein H0N99_02515 [Candidatus Micrarchaeota archaeon]|nr:hypothetical protein [Candidatus Micrarchaeota archaeon]
MRNNAKMALVLILLSLQTPVFAAVGVGTMATNIALALCQFQTLVYTVLPSLSLIMFLFAGLAYASGQVFGSEMRAKAQGWAMSLLVGGIIGIFLAVLAPILVKIFTQMSPGTFTFSCP